MALLAIDPEALQTAAAAPEPRDGFRVPGGFPAGPCWEITEDNVDWLRSGAWRDDLEDSLLIYGVQLDRSEVVELHFDLCCWEGMRKRWTDERGPEPKELSAYLLEGREHWGAWAKALRAIAAEKQRQKNASAAARKARKALRAL